MTKALMRPEYALNALGDPTRRAIFEKLSRGPLSVAHIAKDLPVSRPAVSQHLKVLKDAKLISMEQHGTRSIYRIDREGIQNIRDYLERMWDAALANFRQVAEKIEQQKTT